MLLCCISQLRNRYWNQESADHFNAIKPIISNNNNNNRVWLCPQRLNQKKSRSSWKSSKSQQEEQRGQINRRMLFSSLPRVLISYVNKTGFCIFVGFNTIRAVCPAQRVVLGLDSDTSDPQSFPKHCMLLHATKMCLQPPSAAGRHRPAPLHASLSPKSPVVTMCDICHRLRSPVWWRLFWSRHLRVCTYSKPCNLCKRKKKILQTIVKRLFACHSFY